MKNLIFALLGLTTAAFVEASQTGDLHAFSVPDSHRSLSGFVLKESSTVPVSEAVKKTIFSFPDQGFGQTMHD